MGICSGKNGNVNDDAVKNLQENQEEIKNLEDVKIKQSDFIFEHKARFRDYYAIGSQLGTGAFGEVRKCVNKKTKAQRAVKIIKKDNLDGKEKIRFLYEIEILRQLDHPNIVRLYEVFQDDKRYYLVTELCTGGELFEEIAKRTNFSEQDAAEIIKQVLSAVAYCHAKKICHRDLKPENLLLDSKSNKTIKVIDFGTSQKLDKNSKMDKPFGTAYYIAPEVLDSQYTEKCDVWSVGVILYILLSGRPPFDGKDDKEIVKRVRMGTYSLNGPEWKNISKDAQDLIRKMLSYDPKTRCSAQAAIQHTWIQKTAGQTTDMNIAADALKNLQNFRAEQKMQQAAITFIVSQLASKEELSELRKAFQALDVNNDGKLSREELVNGFKETFGEIAAEDHVDKIMKMVDADGSGEIDYSEWVVATINKNRLLSDEKLEQAFKLFDKDDSGSISSEEVREVLGVRKNIDESVWNEIILEVDDNGDGEISFDEFKLMMQKLLT